jgi:hypothetical protein
MNRSNSFDNSAILNSKARRNKEMIKDRTEVASILCSRSSIYYSRLKHMLIIPNLIISSCSAIINNQNFEYETLKIYNTVVNSITVLLLGLVTTLKVSENADIFRNTATQLTKILHEIESREGSETITTEFITQSTEKYDVLMSTLPHFPNHVKNNVRNEFGTKKWLPLVINGIVKLTVEPDSPVNRSFQIKKNETEV